MPELKDMKELKEKALNYPIECRIKLRGNQRSPKIFIEWMPEENCFLTTEIQEKETFFDEQDLLKDKIGEALVNNNLVIYE